VTGEVRLDTDLYLTVGIILGLLTIPSLLNAWTEGRPPRLGTIVLMISAILIAIALTQRPSGYSFNEIPGVMLKVFGRFVN
jgi:hypothetical protein